MLGISTGKSRGVGLKHRDGMPLLIFIFAACWLLLIAWGRPDLNPDSATALHMARNVLVGDGLASKVVSLGDEELTSRAVVTKPPLYAGSIAVLMSVGVPARLAAWAVTLLSWAGAVTLLFMLARQSLPLWASIVVAMLFAIQVTNVRWGITIHEQALFLVLCYAALWRLTCLASGDEKSHLGLAVTGGLVGLAMITSYQGFPLLLVASAYVAFKCAQAKRLQLLLAYFGGVAAVGAWPFVRFFSLWFSGVRPAFDVSQAKTYGKIFSGVVSAFQNDFFGRQFVWLYDGSGLDVAFLTLFVLGIGSIAFYTAWKKPEWRLLAVFLVTYLIVLVMQLGGAGKVAYEPRWSVLANGLILLLIAFVSRDIWLRTRRFRGIASVVGLVACSLFFWGQFVRYPDLMNSKHGVCPAPRTAGWIASNVPAGSVIAATQCGFELLAESGSHYLVFIPPADSYSISAPRWTGDEFLQLCQMNRSAWVAILGDGHHVVDPLLEKAGYGPVVDGLFNGKVAEGLEVAAQFEDGAVYRVSCP